VLLRVEDLLVNQTELLDKALELVFVEVFVDGVTDLIAILGHHLV
jgi:hypothetical protein